MPTNVTATPIWKEDQAHHEAASQSRHYNLTLAATDISMRAIQSLSHGDTRTAIRSIEYVYRILKRVSDDMSENIRSKAGSTARGEASGVSGGQSIANKDHA